MVPMVSANSACSGVNASRYFRPVSTASPRLLLLDVAFDDRQRRTAHGGHEVSVGPQRGNPRRQPGELFPQHARGASLDGLDQLVHPVLRVDLDEKVHVVEHGFGLHQPRSFLVDNFPDDLFEACLPASADDPAPVFGGTTPRGTRTGTRWSSSS